MTMLEKQIASVEKELAKLAARLERNEAKLVKATAKAEKLNAIEFDEKWNEVNPENPMFRKPEYMPAVEAHFDHFRAEREVEETKQAIENANKRYAKLTGKANEQSEKNAEAQRVERIESGWLKMTAEERKAEYERWLAEFKAECAKDGIKIEQASGAWVIGETKSGKHFVIEINHGFTERSFHCYTLTIEGETIFTSGDFNTAYARIRR